MFSKGFKYNLNLEKVTPDLAFDPLCDDFQVSQFFILKTLSVHERLKDQLLVDDRVVKGDVVFGCQNGPRQRRRPHGAADVRLLINKERKLETQSTNIWPFVFTWNFSS